MLAHIGIVAARESAAARPLARLRRIHPEHPRLPCRPPRLLTRFLLGGRIFLHQPMLCVFSLFFVVKTKTYVGEIVRPIVGTAWCVIFPPPEEAKFIHQAVPSIGRTISLT